MLKGLVSVHKVALHLFDNGGPEASSLQMMHPECYVCIHIMTTLCRQPLHLCFDLKLLELKRVLASITSSS